VRVLALAQHQGDSSDTHSVPGGSTHWAWCLVPIWWCKGSDSSIAKQQEKKRQVCTLTCPALPLRCITIERERERYAKRLYVDLKRGVMGRAPWCKNYTVPLPLASPLTSDRRLAVLDGAIHRSHSVELSGGRATSSTTSLRPVVDRIADPALVAGQGRVLHLATGQGMCTVYGYNTGSRYICLRWLV
jgi:hypothetical protein